MSEFSVITFVAAFAGISLAVAASKAVRARYIAAFAVGVYLWFFTDTLGNANYLNVNQGPVYSVESIVLVVLFAIGAIGFLGSDRSVFSIGEDDVKYGMLVALLAALALGVHGAGEGADFGYTAAQTPSSTLLGAFGGPAAGASWVLHKMLEPTIAAACYVALAGDKGTVDRVIDSAFLAAVFVLPTVVGSMVGYYVTFDHTFIFALGLGASVYAAARVVRPLFTGQGEAAALSLKTAFAIVIGFLCIYAAALLHS